MRALAEASDRSSRRVLQLTDPIDPRTGRVDHAATAELQPLLANPQHRPADLPTRVEEVLERDVVRNRGSGAFGLCDRCKSEPRVVGLALRQQRAGMYVIASNRWDEGLCFAERQQTCTRFAARTQRPIHHEAG